MLTNGGINIGLGPNNGESLSNHVHHSRRRSTFSISTKVHYQPGAANGDSREDSNCKDARGSQACLVVCDYKQKYVANHCDRSSRDEWKATAVCPVRDLGEQDNTNKCAGINDNRH